MKCSIDIENVYILLKLTQAPSAQVNIKIRYDIGTMQINQYNFIRKIVKL